MQWLTNLFSRSKALRKPLLRRCAQLEVESLEERQLLTAGLVDSSFGSLLGTGQVLRSGRSSIDYDALPPVESFIPVAESSSSLAIYNNPERPDLYGSIVVGGSKRRIIATDGSNRVSFNGSFAISRFTAEGEADFDFGVLGRITTSFGPDTVSEVTDLAIQPDDKIVALGRTHNTSPDSNNGIVNGSRRFGLVRYNADGSLDFGFGNDGLLTPDYGIQEQEPSAVALDINEANELEAILVAGTGIDDNFHPVILLARYLPENGELDTSFGEEGVVRLESPARPFSVADMAIQEDGSIVVVGTGKFSLSSDQSIQIIVSRFQPNGDLDLTFGNQGFSRLNFGSEENGAGEVAIGPNGNIVVAGFARIGSSFDFAIARLEPSGDLDTDFGPITTDFNGMDDFATDLVIQPDGKIIVAGTVLDNSSSSSDREDAFLQEIGRSVNQDFGLARFHTEGNAHPDGPLDTLFGESGTGKVTLNLSRKIVAFSDGQRAHSNDVLTDIALQPEGRIIATGTDDLGKVPLAGFRIDEEDKGGVVIGFTNDLLVQTEPTVARRSAPLSGRQDSPPDPENGEPVPPNDSSPQNATASAPLTPTAIAPGAPTSPGTGTTAPPASQIISQAQANLVEAQISSVLQREYRYLLLNLRRPQDPSDTDSPQVPSHHGESFVRALAVGFVNGEATFRLARRIQENYSQVHWIHELQNLIDFLRAVVGMNNRRGSESGDLPYPEQTIPGTVRVKPRPPKEEAKGLFGVEWLLLAGLGVWVGGRCLSDRPHRLSAPKSKPVEKRIKE